MENAAETVASPFVLFGAPHLVTLLLVAGLGYCAYRAGSRVGQAGKARPWALAVAAVLTAVELFKIWLAVDVHGQPWSESLPLHLCRISMLLCAAMLALRSYRIFEVVYFWVIGGSGAAMLTPDLAQGFPHALFLTFFISHALAVLGVLFAMSAYTFRPRLRSIAITAAVSAIYMVLVIPANWLLDANYLYLREKPPSPSLYDFLGPWPWYVLSVWALGLVVCFVCYLPFARLHRAG